MKKCIFLFLIALVACDSTAEDTHSSETNEHTQNETTGKSDSSPGNKTTNKINDIDIYEAELVGRLLDAAGNGSHSMGWMDPEHFSAAKYNKSFREYSVSYGCPDRKFSSSKEDGLDILVSWLEDEDTVEQLDSMMQSEESWLGSNSERLIKLAKSDQVRAIYAAVPYEASEDNEVHCYIFRFDIIKKDGTVIQLDFSWGD